MLTFACLFSFPRYSSFSIMQIRRLGTSFCRQSKETNHKMEGISGNIALNESKLGKDIEL